MDIGGGYSYSSSESVSFRTVAAEATRLLRMRIESEASWIKRRKNADQLRREYVRNAALNAAWWETRDAIVESDTDNLVRVELVRIAINQMDSLGAELEKKHITAVVHANLNEIRKKLDLEPLTKPRSSLGQ